MRVRRKVDVGAAARLVFSLALAWVIPGASAASLYSLLRYDDDFSFLRDPARRTEALDAMKFLPIGSEAWLSFGGESRTRYEYFDHTLWGQGPQDENGFWLQRLMLHGDLHGSEALRTFIQLKSGWAGGRIGGPRPPDEDRFDLNQAFVEARNPFSDSTTWTLRVGRQELGFGSSRVVSPREGPNVRQSFDGVRGMLASGAWKADAFWASPARTSPGVFDDRTDSSQQLWGVYVVAPLVAMSGGHADYYYLGYRNDHARFDQGSGREERHSLGTRFWGRDGACDFNFEALYQFGTFGTGRISAWTFASDTGLTLTEVAGRPRFGLKADIASGDRDPHDAGLQTFNALFPRGGYFNDSAIIGPANFIDLHPSIEFHPTATLALSVDCDFYWRESTRDGIYGPALNLLRSGAVTTAREIGQQPAIRAEWRPDRHWTVVASAAYFVAGRFLRQSGPGENITYFTSWFTYLF